MLKRLCWLAFFAAALFLLVGLAVRAPGILPQPPRVQPQAALAAQAPEARPALDTAGESPRLESGPDVIRLAFTPIRRDLPVLAPYHRVCYYAFHYSDEAG